ncbi:hypothetical protein DIPPA_64950 [Diplonema papillatum]|nr:hypothetical protein DIPPA_64950 [Diplonema papillatum]
MSPGMLLPKAMYFINTCAAVPWGRYKVIYLSSLGFTGVQVGAIRSATHTAKLFAWPLWGWVSDRIGSIRNTLLASLVLATIALEWMRQIGMNPAAGISFSAVLVCAITRSTLNAEWPLVDAATLALVQEQTHEKNGKDGKGDPPEGYGKQRLWACVAWGTGSLFVGVTIDGHGLQSVFYLTYLAIFVEIILVIVWLPRDLKLSKAEPPPEAAKPPLHSAALSNEAKSQNVRQLAFFLVNILFFSIINAIPDQVLFLHMERVGASRTLQGAANAASVIFEIPVFYYADRLLHRFGVKGMCIRAQMFCGLRMFLYSLVPDSSVWMVVVIQTLHGLSFGMMWTAAVAHVQVLAPSGKETFVQSLLCSFWGTLGQAIGAILWGAIYDFYSPQVVYVSGAVLSVAVLLFLTLPSCMWGPTAHRGAPQCSSISCQETPKIGHSWKISPPLGLLHLMDSEARPEVREAPKLSLRPSSPRPA